MSIVGSTSIRAYIVLLYSILFSLNFLVFISLDRLDNLMRLARDKCFERYLLPRQQGVRTKTTMGCPKTPCTYGGRYLTAGYQQASLFPGR